jgi:hypothetical protein
MTTNIYKFTFYLNSEKAFECKAESIDDAWHLFSIRKNISLDYLKETYTIKQV